MSAEALDPLSDAVMVEFWSAGMEFVLTWKVMLEAPARIRAVGAFSSEGAVLPIVTVSPPAGAGLLRVTVHLPDANDSSEVIPHPSEVTVVGLPNAIVADALEPLSEAVRVAVWFAATVPVLAWKVALGDPPATFTVPGTVSVPDAVLPIVTVTPPAGAALLRVTVQVVEAFEFKLGAPHASDVTVVGDTREIVADVLEPFRDAVRVAV